MMPSDGFHRRLKIKLEWVFLAGCFLFIFFTSVERLGDAAFWDESKVYFKPLFSLYHGFWDYFNAPLTLFHRPPGLHFLYLPFLYLFGPHVEVVRILSVVSFMLGIYLFFRSIGVRNKFLAGLTIVFFLLTPIVQVYQVQYVGEIQTFFIYSLVLYLLTFYPTKYGTLFFLGVFAGLSREPSLALVPAIFIYLIMLRQRSWPKIILSSIGPAVGLGLYLIFVYYKTGEFFHHVTIGQGHIDLFRDLGSRGMKTWENLLSPYRLIPLVVTSLLTTVIVWKKIVLSPALIFSAIISASYLFVFSAHSEGIPRYFLAMFPFFIFSLLSVLEPFLSKRFAKIIISGLVLIPLFFIGEPGLVEKPPFYHHNGYQDTSLYRKILQLHEDVISRLKEHTAPNSVVITSWPFIEILKSNDMGYGPSKNYKIIYEQEDASLPDAILYTNYPRQLEWEPIQSILNSGMYSESRFGFREYQVKLFLREKNSKAQ